MPPTPTLTNALAQLRRGGLVVFPTETVYGVGADATNARAVAKLFALKARPRFNPLLVHCAGVRQAMALGEFDDAARTLARAFWPGALSLVVPRRAGCAVADLALAGRATIGLRVPSHRGARALLRAYGRPLAAPSANASGRLSPTAPAHVPAAWSQVVRLRARASSLGLESTIVGCWDGEVFLLRPGAITRADIEKVLRRRLRQPRGASSAPKSPKAHGAPSAPKSPGQLARHYAPRARLRLNARAPRAGEAFLAFGKAPRTKPKAFRNLSPSRDLVEAAANFYRHLHALDKIATRIAVMPIPKHGLGEALNDRLKRGAKR